MVPNWIGIVIFVSLAIALFGRLQVGWSLAVGLITSATCAYAVRQAGQITLRRQIVPLSEPVLEASGGRTIEAAGSSSISRVIGLKGGEVLLAAWIALGFNMLWWSEPSFMNMPRAPVQNYIPEPERPEWWFGSKLSMSQMYAYYSSQATASEAAKFDRDLANSDYRDEVAWVNSQNDSIAGEIYTRRWTKGVALIVLLLLTWLYARRVKAATGSIIPHLTAQVGPS
jgi:hypothetical protein